MAHNPTFVAKGTFVSGAASVSPGLPAGLRNRDLMLLFIQTNNQAVPAAPAGWTEVPSSPQGMGTAAAAGGVRLTMYYKWVLGTETAPATGDSGDLQTAIIMAFRGVNMANPFNVTTGTTQAATTAVSYPGVTTTIDDCMIVHGMANDQDIAGSAQVGAPTNANLTSLTEQHDQTVATGAGGGLAVVTGLKLTAGATGNTTATGAASVAHTYITVALEPNQPLVKPDAQYASDMNTPVPIGGNTTTSGTADATPLYLRTEYSQGNPLDQSATLRVEVDPVGTAFTNSASHTRTMRQKTSDIRSSRRGATIVYDSINKRNLYFGGFDGTTRYNDVWEQYTDVPGQPWRKLSPSGTPPAGRNMNASCIVTGNLTSGGATRSYLIIWGGADPADTNGMWSLRIDTPGSEAWAAITQTNTPAVRGYITRGMVSTPVSGAADQNHIYLFGGWGAARLNDLQRCTFDVDAPTAVTWTALRTDGNATGPSRRSGAILDYKPSTNMLYLFGGYTGTTFTNEFWEYNIGSDTWTNTSPTGTAPLGREMGSGGYDRTNNRFWYMGGWDGTTGPTTMNDIGYISNVGATEAYNEVRAMSRAASTSGGDHSYPPHALSGSVINHDRNLLIEAGMFTYDSTERYFFVHDLNDGITTDKPVYGLTDGEYFNSRDAASSIYNPDHNEWLIVAGFDDMDDDTTIARGTHSSDVWVMNPTDNRWVYSNKGLLSAPPTEGRYVAYDTIRDRILLFGGLSGIDQVSNEIWALERDGNGLYKAVRLNPTGTPPSPRWLGAAAFDAVNNRMIIHGGRNVSTLYNDTYSISFSGGADGVWSTLSPSGTPPTAVWQPAYANVISKNRLYVHGGGTNTGDSTYSSQLLYFDYTTTSGAWTTPTSSGGTARRGAAMAWDSDNDKLIVFGGWNTAVVSGFQWWDIGAGGAWVSPTVSGEVPDGRRSLGGMYAQGKFYITSGRPATGSMWYSDTWSVSPVYDVPNSTVWVRRTPRIYNTAPVRMINGSTSTGYHWQSWLDETTGESVKESYGSNTESFFDFYLGTPSITSPTVTGSAASGIDLGVATANGEVTATGNGAITERGFVLALQASGDPTTGTNIGKKIVAGTTGTFTAQFSGLEPNTLYKYRAYATNSAGTSYSSAVNFTSADFKTFTAYAVMANQGGGTTSLILYNKTDSTEVAASEMSTTSPGPTLVYKTFAYNATNFADNKNYEFRMKASSGSTAVIWSAGLYIKLKELTKTTTYNRVSRMGYAALSAAAAATSQRFLYTAANYSSPVADWIVTGTEDTNGTNNFQLYNVTTTDSGTTGSGVGTGIDVNTNVKTWATTTGVTLVNNNRYIGIFNYTSGGARYHQGIVAITASGAEGTVETQTQIELLDVGRTSQLNTDYEPKASRTFFRPDQFDGATYYFEVIGTNSHASNAYGVTLVAYNAAGTATDVTTQNLTANTGSSNVRYRTGSITIPSDTVELRVRMAGTATAKNLNIAARLIVVQTNATKTLVHVPMGGSNNEENFDTGWPFTTTTQTTYGALANNVDQFTIWKRDDTKFETYYEIITIPEYTIVHTTDAMKKTRFTLVHTSDTIIRDTKHYTREANASLPTVATPRSTGFTVAEYTAVSSDNSTYVDMTGSGNLLFYFERTHTNSTDNISATWNGKSTLAPTASTVYLQIWNKTSTTWETLDSNSVAAADTDFTLSGTQSSSLSNYYDTGNKVVFRVYQVA